MTSHTLIVPREELLRFVRHESLGGEVQKPEQIAELFAGHVVYAQFVQKVPEVEHALNPQLGVVNAETVQSGLSIGGPPGTLEALAEAAESLVKFVPAGGSICIRIFTHRGTEEHVAEGSQSQTAEVVS